MNGLQNRYCVQEVTVGHLLAAGGLILMSTRSSHPVACLDLDGPTVQLEVLEILLYSVPKASIFYSTEAERTTDIAELSLDVLSTPVLQQPALQ